MADMTTYNYYFQVRAFSCTDAVNGLYQAKWFVMDQPTQGASTKFWHEGMNTGTPLATPPVDGVIPMISIEGKTTQALSDAVAAKCQSLAARLTASVVTPLNVPVGTIVPVQVTY
jgi:hypothetical protein